MELKDIASEGLETGIFSDVLKDTWFSPYHEGEYRLKQSNYQLLALAAHMYKVIERVVRKHIVEYLELRG